jgi:hypothetical protein
MYKWFYTLNSGYLCLFIRVIANWITVFSLLKALAFILIPYFYISNII